MILDCRSKMAFQQVMFKFISKQASSFQHLPSVFKTEAIFSLALSLLVRLLISKISSTGSHALSQAFPPSLLSNGSVQLLVSLSNTGYCDRSHNHTAFKCYISSTFDQIRAALTCLQADREV